jgi:hypothetical protein
MCTLTNAFTSTYIHTYCFTKQSANNSAVTFGVGKRRIIITKGAKGTDEERVENV